MQAFVGLKSKRVYNVVTDTHNCLQAQCYHLVASHQYHKFYKLENFDI
jgi:hypothetical protein